MRLMLILVLSQSSVQKVSPRYNLEPGTKRSLFRFKNGYKIEMQVISICFKSVRMPYIMMKKTFNSLVKKIAKIDPLRAEYLKRHVKHDTTSDSLVYTGDQKVIKGILKLFTKSK